MPLRFFADDTIAGRHAIDACHFDAATLLYAAAASDTSRAYAAYSFDISALPPCLLPPPRARVVLSQCVYYLCARAAFALL